MRTTARITVRRLCPSLGFRQDVSCRIVVPVGHVLARRADMRPDREGLLHNLPAIRAQLRGEVGRYLIHPNPSTYLLAFHTLSLRALIPALICSARSMLSARPCPPLFEDFMVWNCTAISALVLFTMRKDNIRRRASAAWFPRMRKRFEVLLPRRMSFDKDNLPPNMLLANCKGARSELEKLISKLYSGEPVLPLPRRMYTHPSPSKKPARYITAASLSTNP